VEEKRDLMESSECRIKKRFDGKHECRREKKFDGKQRI
jgi:hypothetical protein